jgi:heptose I phosphotransferase
VRWSWYSSDFRAFLPADLPETVMEIESVDRLHEKQGRSTARIRFDTAAGPMGVYLKRHVRLSWAKRLGALLFPWRHYSPGAAEFANLNHARSLGVPVPDVVAAGESIGPWGRLQSYLIVAELSGADELNLIVPRMSRWLSPLDFAAWKRQVVREMARLVARLHGAGWFHRDLYLCHFFHPIDAAATGPAKLTLIDLHRLSRHRLTAARWRAKDLGQLLFSSYGVAGIAARDRLRFWRSYCEIVHPLSPRIQARLIRAKAARYQAHDHAAAARSA